jgi:hypothetical protein
MSGMSRPCTACVLADAWDADSSTSEKRMEMKAKEKNTSAAGFIAPS